MSALSPRLKRDDWLSALPRALVAGFVKTDKEFQAKGRFLDMEEVAPFGSSQISTLLTLFHLQSILQETEGMLWCVAEQTSGTTVTFVVIDGWTITVASVGDSKCVLDSQGVVSDLTVDHRLDCNEEEYDHKLLNPASMI